jgi:plastocyanin
MNPRPTILAKTSIALTIALLATAGASAAEWGSLKGRFVVDGTAPKPDPLVVTKDQFCIDKKPKNQSLLVSDKNELADAVIYVLLGAGEKIEVHPDYAAGLNQTVVLDNNGCSFHPHIAFVRTGQPFEIKNSDPVGHNTNVTLTKNASFNDLIAAGNNSKKTFTKAEVMPMPVRCNIHPWMEGSVLVLEHPYAAISGADGTFEIKNIPAGKHKFKLWHESGNLKNVKLPGGTTDRKGVAELTIAAGQTLDLGDIKIPAASLKK